MLTIKDVLKLAKAKHSLPALRSVVFDGQSAICASELEWMVGVPCPQPGLAGPVVVPVEAVLAHLAKSRHLVVMPDHLTNGQGLVTPFNKSPKVDYDSVLSMMPSQPEGEAVSFALELNALDRVLIAAADEDVRYYLRGVMFDLTEGVMVGTNGHRLHVYRNRVPQVYGREVVDGVPTAAPVQCILPRGPLDWVLGSRGDTVKATIWNPRGGDDVRPQVLLQAEDCFVWIRKPIEGRFPDWARAVPALAQRPAWVSLDPVRLSDSAAAMATVRRIAGDTSGVVLVDFAAGAVHGVRPDELLPLSTTVHSDHADLDVASLAGALTVGVCAQYLQDLADCVTSGAQWRLSHLNASAEALMAVDGDFTGIVMPVKAKKPQPTTQAQPADQESEPEPEPCPAAVAAMASQLVGKAQESAKKAPAKTRKARQPVAA